MNLFDPASVEGTAALNHFSQLLDDYESDLPTDRSSGLPPAQLMEEATDELGGREEYRGVFRASVLRFCEEMVVDSNDMMNAYFALGRSDHLFPSWLREWMADQPLRLVCRAMRLVRS